MECIKIESFEDMFYSCNRLEDISSLINWRIPKSTNTYNMFSDCNIYLLNKWKLSQRKYNYLFTSHL